MIKKFFAAVFSLSFVLSAYADIQGCRVPDQKFQFPLRALPGDVGYFYCEVQPTVPLLTFKPSNAKVNGIESGGTTFAGDLDIAALNKVYFTFNLDPFRGVGVGTMKVEYVGSANEVVCHHGKGSRTIELRS